MGMDSAGWLSHERPSSQQHLQGWRGKTFMLSLPSALTARGHACELFFFERGTMEPLLPADVASISAGSPIVSDWLEAAASRWSTQQRGLDDRHLAVRAIGAKLILTRTKLGIRHGLRLDRRELRRPDSGLEWCQERPAAIYRRTDQVVRNGIDLGWFARNERLRRPTNRGLGWTGRVSVEAPRQVRRHRAALHAPAFGVGRRSHGIEKTAEARRTRSLCCARSRRCGGAFPLKTCGGSITKSPQVAGVVTTSSREVSVWRA